MNTHDNERLFSFTYKQRRELLSENDKNVYDDILNALTEGVDSFKLRTSPTKKLINIISDVEYDNPLVPRVKQITWTPGIRPKVTVEYRCTVLRWKILLPKIKQRALEIYNEVYNDFPYETLVNIHNYFSENFEYKLDDKGDCYCVIGPLINRTAVCAGFACTAKLICDMCRIKSVGICGSLCEHERPVPENPVPCPQKKITHAWNGVFIAGAWYYCDFSNDINVSDFDFPRFDYFCTTRREMLKSRDFEDISLIPEGKSQFSYYSVKGLIVSSSKQIIEIVKRRKNIKTFSFKISPEWKNFNQAKVANDIVRAIRVEIRYSYSPKSSVFGMRIV